VRARPQRPRAPDEDFLLLSAGMLAVAAKIVETIRNLETSHVWRVFYFHGMQSFHDLFESWPSSPL
jgi:hypothetical protein